MEERETLEPIHRRKARAKRERGKCDYMVSGSILAYENMGMEKKRGEHRWGNLGMGDMGRSRERERGGGGEGGARRSKKTRVMN